MLCLTRRDGEEIVIGDNVTIRVLSIGNGRVSLGFVAPKDIPIVRAELRELPPEGREFMDAALPASARTK